MHADILTNVSFHEKDRLELIQSPDNEKCL